MSDLRGNNIIDSRDVIARIEELESDRQDIFDRIDEVEKNSDLPGPIHDELEAWDADYGDELLALKELAEEGENSSFDWSYGVTLIHDSYFEDYAKELATETGALSNTNEWPGRCIDWAQAAEELQADYTPVDFDGETYWVR